MKLSLFKQIESLMRPVNTLRTEKNFSEKHDAQRPLVDVLIHLYQYTDHSRPDQPAVGAPPFGRDIYCVMLPAETSEIAKCFSPFPGKMPGQNAEGILKTHKLLV